MDSHVVIKIGDKEECINIGQEFHDFIQSRGNFTTEQKSALKNNTIEIFKKLSLKKSTTGLILGYVQSGKTLSFTSLIALARDNFYGIIILLAGKTNLLKLQSKNRLSNDLGVTNGNRKYSIIESYSKSDYQLYSNILDAWSDDSYEDFERSTIVIPILKEKSNLTKLIELMTSLGSKNFKFPVLIIDDESDQASPNAFERKVGKSETPIHKSIVQLKSIFQESKFIQYTATPQANLLANLANSLSPDFLHLLEPGEGYAGGRYYFHEHKKNLLRLIDSKSDCIELNQNSELYEAMAAFIIGVADGFQKSAELLTSPKGNRSMLIHPSSLKVEQANSLIIVQTAIDMWKHEFKNELTGNTEALFKSAYDDISSTYADLADWALLIKYIPKAISKIVTRTVNGLDPANDGVDWSNYAHILIGGNKLDRGFTVEGLTVTFMSRAISKKSHNIDSIQQRARFFGYKKNYIGLCRVYMDHDNISAFTNYADHEVSLRAELLPYNSIGKNLKEWLRIFELSDSMNPTRKNVYEGDVSEVINSKNWLFLNTLRFPEISASNFKILNAFFDKTKLEVSPLSGNTEQTKHSVIEAESNFICEKLLELNFGDPEGRVIAINVFKFLVKNYKSIDLYLMSSGKPKSRKDKNDSLDIGPWLFQGAIISSGYKGDSKVILKDRATIQVHYVEMNSGIHPVIAIKLPATNVMRPHIHDK